MARYSTHGCTREQNFDLDFCFTQIFRFPSFHFSSTNNVRNIRFYLFFFFSSDIRTFVHRSYAYIGYNWCIKSFLFFFRVAHRGRKNNNDKYIYIVSPLLVLSLQRLFYVSLSTCRNRNNHSTLHCTHFVFNVH